MPGIMFLCVSMAISATIILILGLGQRSPRSPPTPAELLDEADALIEPA